MVSRLVAPRGMGMAPPRAAQAYRALQRFHAASPTCDSLVVNIGCMAEGGRDTGIYGRFLAQPPVDGALAALAVLSHRSAAALLNLRGSARALIDVSTPGRGKRTRPGIDLHRSTTLKPPDTTRVSNIPCTTVARTLLDLAEVINRRSLERAFDESEVRRVFDLRAIAARGQRVDCPG